MAFKIQLRRKRKVGNCVICSKQYEGQDGSKYCGLDCRREAHRNAQRMHSSKKTPKPKRPLSNCLGCSSSFQPRAITHKYCSIACKDKHKNDVRSKNRAKDRESDDPVLACYICQKPFKQTWPRHSALTCSTSCSTRYTNQNYHREKQKFLDAHGIELWKFKTKLRNDSYLLRKSVKKTDPAST